MQFVAAVGHQLHDHIIDKLAAGCGTGQGSEALLQQCCAVLATAGYFLVQKFRQSIFLCLWFDTGQGCGGTFHPLANKLGHSLLQGSAAFFCVISPVQLLTVELTDQLAHRLTDGFGKAVKVAGIVLVKNMRGAAADGLVYYLVSLGCNG